MRLHTLKPRPGARHRVKRLGCGESSGHGKTSGKGHKGQKARSGGSIRLGFEGGQMPLIRRIPKRGFNNTAFGIVYAPVNVSSLEKLEAAGKIDEKVLRDAGLVKGTWDGVKILGDGELKKKVTVLVNAISSSAKTKIESAGGKVEIVPKPAAPKKAQKPKAGSAKA
jgi:large subunit ribosomal protein L15